MSDHITDEMVEAAVSAVAVRLQDPRRHGKSQPALLREALDAAIAVAPAVGDGVDHPFGPWVWCAHHDGFVRHAHRKGTSGVVTWRHLPGDGPHRRLVLGPTIEEDDRG